MLALTEGTTRQFQGHLQDLSGVEVSPTLISAVTDAVREDVSAWQSRPLEPAGPIVYLDALHVQMRRERQFTPCAVYLALAKALSGYDDPCHCTGSGPTGPGINALVVRSTSSEVRRPKYVVRLTPFKPLTPVRHPSACEDRGRGG